MNKVYSLLWSAANSLGITEKLRMSKTAWRETGKENKNETDLSRHLKGNAISLRILF